MSNKEFVLSVFDKNTPSNLVVENILSRTGLDGEEPFAEENRARLEVACAKQIPWMIQIHLRSAKADFLCLGLIMLIA